MARKIRGIIFDMDGVLIDAKDWHYEAMNRALGLLGFTIPRFDHVTTYDGLPTRVKLEMFSKERGLPRSLHRFISEMKQIYTQELIHSRCKPLFAHEYALSRLAAEGYKLAVASNSIRLTIDLMLDKAALSKYLSATVSNEDVKAAKPDPEIYLKAVELLNLPAEECLVLEDNVNGIKAAEAAKCPVMKIHSVHDVTYDRIRRHVDAVESGAVSPSAGNQ
jgi:beta-phosphoglucomutase